MFKKNSPDGGIGRRTRFRCERINIFGSSSLLLGTILFFIPYDIIAKPSCIDFSSDNVVMNTAAHICSLEGNVLLSLNNDENKYEFRADKIMVFYEKQLISNPKKVEAFGEVIFSYKELKIYSSYCRYDRDNIFFGGSVLIKDVNLGTINANKAIYNLETKKIDIISNEKVRIVFRNKFFNALHDSSK